MCQDLMHRDARDSLDRHQSSLAAAEQAWRQEVAAVREECEAKLAALHAAQDAALQDAQAELAAVMEQAAAALASRPEQGQYMEVCYFPSESAREDIISTFTCPQTLQCNFLLPEP